MQADYGNGIFGDVEPFDEAKLREALESGAENVKVFSNPSNEFDEAKGRSDKSKIRFKYMTKNQKKRLRKRGYS